MDYEDILRVKVTFEDFRGLVSSLFQGKIIQGSEN